MRCVENCSSLPYALHEKNGEELIIQLTTEAYLVLCSTRRGVPRGTTITMLLCNS